MQRKKRSTRGKASPVKAPESFPDQAVTEHIEAADEEAADVKKQKKTANPQEEKRKTSPKAVPDVVMLDAVVSDSEKGEEEEGSDAEFVAMPKGSKKVRTSVSRPRISHIMNRYNLVQLTLVILCA